MRDPHIIIGAFIEKYMRDTGNKLKLTATPQKVGGFVIRVESVSTRARPYFSKAVAALTMDGAMQDMAKAVDTAKHVEVPSARAG